MCLFYKKETWCGQDRTQLTSSLYQQETSTLAAKAIQTKKFISMNIHVCSLVKVCKNQYLARFSRNHGIYLDKFQDLRQIFKLIRAHLLANDNDLPCCWKSISEQIISKRDRKFETNYKNKQAYERTQAVSAYISSRQSIQTILGAYYDSHLTLHLNFSSKASINFNSRLTMGGMSHRIHPDHCHTLLNLLHCPAAKRKLTLQVYF